MRCVCGCSPRAATLPAERLASPPARQVQVALKGDTVLPLPQFS